LPTSEGSRSRSKDYNAGFPFASPCFPAPPVQQLLEIRSRVIRAPLSDLIANIISRRARNARVAKRMCGMRLVIRSRARMESRTGDCRGSNAIENDRFVLFLLRARDYGRLVSFVSSICAEQRSLRPLIAGVSRVWLVDSSAMNSIKRPPRCSSFS